MKCGCDETKTVRYKYTVAVQSPGGTAGAGGHVDLSDDSNWTAQGTIKANIISKGGREFISGKKVAADVSHVFETPFTNFAATIDPKWRLVFDSRKFEIIAAYDENEMRKKVIIHTREAK